MNLPSTVRIFEDAARYICEFLGRPTGSRVARALMAKAA